jgi:hypothetical protein
MKNLPKVWDKVIIRSDLVNEKEYGMETWYDYMKTWEQTVSHVLDYWVFSIVWCRMNYTPEMIKSD